MPGWHKTRRTPQNGLIGRSFSEILLQGSDRQISAGDFLASTLALAEQLPSKSYVINLHRNRHEFLHTFCASILAGQCTLMPPNRQEQTLLDLEEAYADCYRIGGDAETAAQLPSFSNRGFQGEIPVIPPAQECVIAFTSGSTGHPSPNIKSWHTLYASTQANCAALLQDQSEHVNLLATVPAQHMWGLETSILMPLFADIAISAAHPLYPQDIVFALQEMPSPRVLVSSPLHLEALLKSDLPLPELAQVFTATAPLSPAAAQQMEAHFHAPVMDVFGSSETGVFAVRRTAREELWNVSAPFALDVVEQETRVSAEHLSSTMVLADRVELVGAQQFRWLGREHDQVNVAGKRASLADLNRRLLAIEGLEDGVIFKPEENTRRLAALVAAPALSAADIRTVLARELDPVFLPRPVVFVAEMPRNETGKMSLATVQAMFSAWRAEQNRDAELK